MLRILRWINQILSLILASSVVVKASPNIQYQTNQYNTIIQNYYNEITENENEITDDAFEGYESEKEAVLGEPDKSINIGGFQLEFVSISWVINHLTCYKFECSHWWIKKNIFYKIWSSIWML